MPRLNIEDDFWLEITTVIEKVGDSDKAIGNAIRFFRYAQSKAKRSKLIQNEEFKANGFLEELVPIFAKKVEGGYVCAGSEKHFNWLKTRSDSGRKGGLSKKKQANGSKRKQNEENVSKQQFSNPLTLTLPLPLKKKKNKEEKLKYKSDLEECLQIWLQTLKYFNSNRGVIPGEDMLIARRIGTHTAIVVKLALVGARHEQKTDNFDPAKYLSVHRILDIQKIDKFATLGSQQQKSNQLKTIEQIDKEEADASSNRAI